MKIVRRLTICCLLLWCFTGSVMAQGDNPYVIKVRQSNHYLSHVKVGDNYVIQDKTTFTPECLWYSGIEQSVTGTTHNYYFIDENGKYRYLAAPFGKNKTLGLSDDLPPTYLLTNTDTIYYFYDWDQEEKPDGGGVARGHQYTSINSQSTCEDCGYSWAKGECWEVYWLVYSDGDWKTSSTSYYGIDSIPHVNGHSPGGRFHKVTVEPNPKTITGFSPAFGSFGDWTPTAVDQNKTYSVTAEPCAITYIPTYYEYSFSEMQINGNDTTHRVPIDLGPFCGNTPGIPTATTSSGCTPTHYEWTITGDGAQFISFASGSTVHSLSGNITGTQTLSGTVYYNVANNTGTKTATVKLVVTYDDGSTQERQATIRLTTDCQNPTQAAAPVLNYDDVTLSWYNIADHYELYYRKNRATYPWDTIPVGHSTGEIASYTLHGLEYDTVYQYKVKAFCDPSGPGCADPTIVYTFETRDKPNLLIYGSVFGGGRMADVKGKTEIEIVNCDSIGAVFGGNDIAGTVGNGTKGSIITLGTAASDSTIRIGSVYGGGNGYYAYGSQTFAPVASTATTVTVHGNASVYALSEAGAWDNEVWKNPISSDSTLTVPSITKSTITVANDFVKVDSIFGGAKNAFLTLNDNTENGSSITINGGIVKAVFGGNNVGGSQGAAKQHIEVNQTKILLEDSIINTATTGYGCDFGIRYLYGGGNKVKASTTEVIINGGQLDTIFAGGNSADVAAANITMNCELGAKSGDYTFGKVYTNAIDPDNYSTGTIGENTIRSSYKWNGISGIYNVRTLFGGNNQANMDTVPTITLTSGSVGTVYGGGNAGDMNGGKDDPGDIATDFGPLVFERDIANPSDNETIIRKYSTYVELASDATVLVDYLYGGCQMSDVYYSSWVQMFGGHVGTVYGGCNISGDVGSRYLLEDNDPLLEEEGVVSAYKLGPKHEKYQAVKGGIFVKVSGGHIYKDLFAGSNGRYHCNNGRVYVSGVDFDDLDAEGRYLGLTIPSHNETHVYVSGTAVVGGSVYAGGNLACVGFINESVPERFYTPVFVGMASVRMDGGHVYGNVFGGGNMASIWGSNSVKVEGGIIGGALYGGNDRIGLVAQITNRVLPSDYGFASDGRTSLADVRTYISLTGRPDVNTVYGGGNGDYDYSIGQYCNSNDQPVQSNTFVDINIDGFKDPVTDADGGHISTVYGGGNGVTVTGTTTVFLNVKGNGGAEPTAYDHVDNIFGGNNKGPLAILPDIILLKGQVNTVYGGCNKGAMVGSNSVTSGTDTYDNIGSMVRLRSSYKASDTATVVTPTAKVSNAVYGGCRMNGVSNNSLVLVEGGTFGDTVSFFGGSDISGIIEGTSHVILKAGTVGNMFGGGNGNYDYDGHNVYIAGSSHTPENLIATDTVNVLRPSCSYTQVDMKGGTAANLYGGGNAAGVTNTALVNMNGGLVTTGIYGGCCSMDTVFGPVTVNVLGGTVGSTESLANIHGGGYGQNTSTKDNVTVNIGSIDAASAAATPTIYGSIYGGSALGNVNNSASNLTTVNFLNGTLKGNGSTIFGAIYGGGLGQYIDNAHDSIPAKVNGKVYVNIGNNDQDPDECFIDLREADVFGGNNTYGSPQDSVTVNVYRTAHSYTTYPDGVTSDNYLANYIGDNPQYSIRQVFGGGNKADYAPENGSTSSTKLTTVNVFTCENTIGRAFGGGNAAAAHKVASYIYGGRFHQVFGGGNGTADIPANIGVGGSSLNVYNGNILQLFGGNNINGEITGPMFVNITNNGTCNENIAEFFGGSNQAVMGSINPVDLITNINCGAEPVNIHTVYGGSNMAAITGNVTLNIKGGEYKNVFGGSKGEGGTAADINGNVTLNLLGGSIQQAFGGSNINGNITDKITVNVLDTVASCGLQLDTVYGSGNLTAYTPTDPSIASPEVNILKGTVNKVVFGGGKGSTAVVTANPRVTIGDTTHSTYVTKVYGEVFGGGNAAPVSGNTTVVCQANYATDTIYRLFGGGNEAGVSGNATVTMNSGKITQGIYGGCNANDTVKGNISINITGGTLGIKGSPMTQGIFGGGYGQNTRTTGNVTVTINKPSTDTIFADVYGGSALGHVAANTDAVVKLAKVDFQSGTLHGALFGGGMGDNTYSAEVTGNAQLAIAGNVMDSVYGGCNYNGIVKGNTVVGITGGTIGVETRPNRGVVYGGGLGLNTKVKGSVAVTINNATGDIYGDVYGGSAMGLVNCNEAGNGLNPGSTTNVTLTSGTIHGDLYGGGHGLESHEADVYGDVTVTVNGGSVNNVFGCNNLLGQPKNNVTVIIDETTPSTMSVDSVFGGGNQAYYEGTPQVRIRKGTVNYKVFGGGNNIADDNQGVGGSDVLMSGGTVLVGIYGGCNTDGDVTGDALVKLTGGTIGATGARANIHGGGFGQNTTVKGNVTVTFGDLNATTDLEYPMLYGDLYGGSALGTVNDEASDLTTVNLYSGTITGSGEDPEEFDKYYGNVFGGGLGDLTTPARVNGEIHVNIGSETGGKATLSRCSVYGCNNVKGSPQSDVYVDMYQTAHTEKDDVGYFEMDKQYALYQVFGGGNRAHYAPENNNPNSSKRTHVTIHECENTVRDVYGGGNAADAVGVVTIIQGGRFNEVYGGGNGRVTAANIGYGGIGLNVVAGNVSFLFRGSNKNGENHGPDYYPAAVSTCLGGLFVDSYFFGTNEAELYYDLNNTITCAEAGNFEYRYVYAGSRWGIVYGDISLTVCGGTIENLFGGCKGYNDYSADVRRFPTFDEITEDLKLPEENRKYSQALRDHMGYPDGPVPSYAGHGGNINLIVNGGTIGKVFGGCDERGNVEGKITLTVNDAESTSCPLFIGEVYGGSNKWYYQPLYDTINSPEVEIIRGTIGGIHTDLPVNNVSGTAPTEYEGNVFGGGNFGDVTSNPVVIVGDGPSAKLTIKGNVFGGGNEGDITGSPRVIIVPNTHTLSITAATGGNIVRVTNTVGEEVSSGTPVGEGISLNLSAIPSTNYTFDHWSVTPSGNGTITNPNSASTSFTMGTGNCTIAAVFTEAANKPVLSFSVDPAAGGTMVVKDAQGDTLHSGDHIGEGSVLTLSATPNTSYKFKEWQVNDEPIINPANTTYTMGATATTLKAVFEAVPTHTFTLTSPEHGTVVIKDVHGTTVTSPASIGEGAVLSVTATPDANYALGRWTVSGGDIDNDVANEISFIMGKENATLTASFVPTHSFSITDPENGTIKITDALGYTVNSGASIGVGAVLNLRAKPVAGYAFKVWQLTSGDGVIANPNAPITSLIMGTNDAVIKAIFVRAHTLTITPPENGTIKVTNVLNQSVSSPASIGEGAVLNLVASPKEDHTFVRWEITRGDDTTTDTNASTTLTMGEEDTTIRAIFN